MKVAVVGGGWAGMAGADMLVRAGHEVTVFELSQQLGGRARGLHDPNLGLIDNGQHLLIGAYTHTLDLIERAHGACSSERHATNPPFLRTPLHLSAADRSIQLRTPSFCRNRLGRLMGMMNARGFTLQERWHAINLLLGLHRGKRTPDIKQTVSQWLLQNKQSHNLQTLLWIPLCLATMNTPPERACARTFARVLKDSLLSAEPCASDLIVPRYDLTELWIDSVAKQVNVVFGAQIREVTATPNGVEIQSQQFDGCIIATPPSSASRIVKNWPEGTSNQLIETLDSFEFLPITTCYVELVEPFRLPDPMLMLRSGHEPSHSTRHLGHWVFDRNAFRDTRNTPGRLAFVISHAGQENLDRQTLAHRLLEQLIAELSLGSTHLKGSAIKLRTSKIITEKRATFASTPALSRPSHQTHWPSIVLAGDWTDTGYPSVLEGAVMSGQKAADMLIKQVLR